MVINLPFGRKPNAFAIGIPVLNIIGVTKGGNEMWTEAEREGILAHERTHINQCHSVIKYGLAHAIQKQQMKAVAEGDKDKAVKILLGGIAARCSLSYVMERLADNGAKRKGHGKALASALGQCEDRGWMHVLAALGGNSHPRTANRQRRLTK